MELEKARQLYMATQKLNIDVRYAEPFGCGYTEVRIFLQPWALMEGDYLELGSIQCIIWVILMSKFRTLKSE